MQLVTLLGVLLGFWLRMDYRDVVMKGRSL
jgi:hypothetical protein